MRTTTRCCLAIVAVALLACNGESVVNPGVAGAGVTTAIVGVDHDSSGYNVRYKMTNRDTADVAYSGCTGAVEVPDGGGWKSVTHWGQCQLSTGLLSPGSSVTLSIPRQTLDQGTPIRVSLSWHFALTTRDVSNLSTSAPAIVP